MALYGVRLPAFTHSDPSKLNSSKEMGMLIGYGPGWNPTWWGSYLCTGPQAWWLWSHVRVCLQQPGSCAPGSPGKSHWWRTLWPCPVRWPTMPGVRPLSWRQRGSRRKEKVTFQLRGEIVTVDPADGWMSLPGHILMDALKASLRVVLAHIRQVKIKIVEGFGRGISLGDFDAL